jgi:hypothetical protein
VAPNFREFANRPAITTRSLAHFFITHAPWHEESIAYEMQNPMLYPDQAKAVSLYILSVRDNCGFANALTAH